MFYHGWGETDEGAAFSFVSADYDYIETLNMQMAEGRSFSKNFPTDTANFIFNQKAIELIGYQSPVGKNFGIDDQSGTIIGVVKDFNSLPLQYEIEPLMMLMIPDYYRWLLIKTKSLNVVSTIDYIENEWKNAVPHYPFEYHFLDERFDRLYQDEIRAGRLFGYFVILAIVISCLGLLGLSSFAAEQRTKEIGVRKVLGASIWGIVQILSKEFILLVAISNIAAWPIAYYAMNKWLQSFAYRIDITWNTFVLAALLALATATCPCSFFAISAL